MTSDELREIEERLRDIKTTSTAHREGERVHLSMNDWMLVVRTTDHLLAHVRELREALKPFNREAKKILKTPMGIRNLVTAKFLDSELDRAAAAYGGDDAEK